jgi:hypothetical protein
MQLNENINNSGADIVRSKNNSGFMYYSNSMLANGDSGPSTSQKSINYSNTNSIRSTSLSSYNCYWTQRYKKPSTCLNFKRENIETYTDVNGVIFKVSG